MANLLLLPTELIYEIFDHLQPVDEVHPLHRKSDTFDPQTVWEYHNSNRALLNLARTCKFLQPIAIECLFKYQWAPYRYPNHVVLRRLKQDRAAGLAIKHIRVLQYGPHCRYEGRSRDETKRHLRQVGLLDWTDVKLLLDHDPAQLEVAIMVAHAPNLESLRMKVWHESELTPNDQLPVWLRPIADAGRAFFHRPHDHYSFGRLRTLNIQGQSLCSPDLAYLFCLPRLDRLQLSGVVQEIPLGESKPFPWPVKHGSSSLRELKVTEIEAPAEIIAHMIRSCKALSLFRCRRSDDVRLLEEEMLINNTNDSRAWCAEILAAVNQHKSSLKFLELQSIEEEMMTLDMFFEYEPLDLFRELQALEVLIIPYMLLMGRPSNTTIAASTTPPYIPMRAVLPRSLARLTLLMHPWTAPLVTEEAILSCIPLDNGDTKPLGNSSIQEVKIMYDRGFEYSTLPLNFWQIKHDLRQRGIRCDYQMRFAIAYAEVCDGSFDEEQLDVVAQELSTYGLKGLEMAQHFGDASEDLETRLYKLLGLDEDKLLTKEEREIMFLDDDDNKDVDGTVHQSLRNLADHLYVRTRNGDIKNPTAH